MGVINHLLTGMILQVVDGWTNPLEKIFSQIGNLSQIGGEHNKMFETTT